jgi:hypothetical protein
MDTMTMAAPTAASHTTEFFHFPANQAYESNLPCPQLLQEEEDFLNQPIKEVDTLALKGGAFLLMLAAAAGCVVSWLW